jgi:ketosteroid isomerase-like protein
MDRSRAKVLLDELHQAPQNEFYAGGESGSLRALLAPGIRWVVPGENALAGTYHGFDEAFAYFLRRRDLATGTFRMHRRDVLVGEGDRIAALTDGTATIAGHERRWSTVGIYHVVDQRQIAACWLLPFDQREFDSIWSG